MRIPIISTLDELAPPPRRFLAFSALNVVSWQCIVGSALTLFARNVGMPASWVGFLISFMPLSTLLVVATVPLVTRLGPKRLMLRTWFSRNLSVCMVFLMPWAARHWGPKAAWYVLMAATLAFCLMRALGAGAWFAWLHEVTPEDQRGAYFSAETSVVQLISVAVLFGQGFILSGTPGIGRFLVIYGLGIFAGLVSLIWMYQVPGGQAVQEDSVSAGNSFLSCRQAWEDRPFRWFALTASLSFVATSWLGSSVVLYMRDALEVSSRTIMIFTAVGSLAILATIRFWARFAEHSGSGRAMFKAMTGHSLMALAYLTLIPGAAWTHYALCPIVALSSIFGAAFSVATNRALLNSVKTEGRVGYTTLWTVATALATGITPILVGIIIDRWGIWGFRLCFGLSGSLGLFCALTSRFLVQDGAPVKLSLGEIIDPALPVRALARIAWITLGLHESSRAPRV